MASRVSEAKGRSARWWLVGGSVAMGIGVWSMHFIGMLAFRFPMPMGYDPAITFLSLLVGIASSAIALWIVCQPELSPVRLCVGAVLMGTGISAMHYIGMSAMYMSPDIHYVPSIFILSVLIGIGASGAALWIAFRLRWQSSRVRLLRSGASVVMGFAIAGMHYTGMAAARFPKNSASPMAHAGLSADWLAALVLVFAVSVLSIALITSALISSMLEFRTSHLTSSLADAHQELQFLALHDGLTKLPNRLLLEDRLNQEIGNAKRSLKAFTVLFLDLDGFKQINDAFGHHIGDLLLVEVAHRIRAIGRTRDTVARVGGDEFVVLADTAEATEAANLADTLVKGLRQPYTIAGHTCQVTVSIGIAIYNCDDVDHGEILKNADAAMYHAKSLGRNTHCFFDVSMNDDTREKLQLMHDLRLALDQKEELVLYYQPKFDASTGAMIGAEALIRWHHPARGLILPGDFIPLAENIGLIVPIGEWTLQKACLQMSEWQADGYTDWTIAVNLSAVQFNHPGLAELVSKSLNRYKLDPSCLILEITESTAMRDPAASLIILENLRQMGVRISIDDFGTGYSSLLYLKRLPASELKIDRGFVRELAQENEDAAIISAIVALGRTLNLEVVAEGVETVAQQEFLTRLGCSSLQGFLLGRPMPPEQLVKYVAEESIAWNLEAADVD